MWASDCRVESGIIVLLLGARADFARLPTSAAVGTAWRRAAMPSNADRLASRGRQNYGMAKPGDDLKPAPNTLVPAAA